jgi:hypothetical protein
MVRRLSFNLLLICLFACTDQGKPVHYAIGNVSSFDLSVILFNENIPVDTVFIRISDSKVLSQDLPPYDSGPFSGHDSLLVIFSDYKRLTYKPHKSNSECSDMNKNPFCHYTAYICSSGICTFFVDDTEYLKAK